jgi:hypothetical protein
MPNAPGRTGGGFALGAAAAQSASAQALPPMLRQIFHPERDTEGVPYHGQHDPQMYTPEALAARAALREHPALVDALHRFGQLYTPDAGGNVSRLEYARVHVGIVQALMGHHVRSEAQVRETIDEDWESDSAGHLVLTPLRLSDALFEMTDLWCPGLDVEEYVSFLDALADRIAPGLAARRA